MEWAPYVFLKNFNADVNVRHDPHTMYFYSFTSQRHEQSQPTSILTSLRSKLEATGQGASTRSRKYASLISEPLSDKKVIELPGIGEVLAATLERNGFGKVRRSFVTPCFKICLLART